MNVIFTNHLQQTLNELDETLKDALDEFIFHVKNMAYVACKVATNHQLT